MIDSYFSRKYCNSYILYNEDKKGILVDPGCNENNCLINHIERIGVEIVSILITHAHYDHIMGLEDIVNRFPNATTYILNEELEGLVDPRINLSKYTNDECPKILDFKPEKLVAVYDGEEFESCGFKIKVIATPFHTIGSCCYLVASEDALFSGDTLFYTTIGRTDLPTGSSKTVESSLAKLLPLGDEVKVYPGHGVLTTMGREKTYNSYLRNI